MVERIFFREKAYNLIEFTDLDIGENIFTMIIGKNGTGKSTLLSSIVSELLTIYNDRFYNENELGFSKKSYGGLKVDHHPYNVIAVSSSPFDKFPLTKRFNDIKSYTYLGLRDLSSMNFGLSYMSKIISSLIESIDENPIHWENLAEVLNYLGYREEISAKFSFNINKSIIEEFLGSDYIHDIFSHTSRLLSRTINRRFFQNENGDLDIEKIEYLKFLVARLLHDEFRTNSVISLYISYEGIKIESHDFGFSNSEIIFLINSGVVKLRDIGLIKKNRTTVYSIKDSSSGEQSVILSILGIASKITDNSIICIDEPEVCLHPEWQEKYIQILTRTFRKFRNCHFIIATHSPQIISKLSPRNCFIVSMEDAEIVNASIYINNSIDYQLANVFKSPGFKNEYLSRLAFTIFSNVSKTKKFESVDIKNFKILSNAFKSLEDTDPVKELISVLIELHKKYA